MVLVWVLEAMGSFYRRGRGKSNKGMNTENLRLKTEKWEDGGGRIGERGKRCPSGAFAKGKSDPESSRARCARRELRSRCARESKPKRAVSALQARTATIEVAESRFCSLNGRTESLEREMCARGVEPRLAALRLLGQVRNSRPPSLPFGRLLCSPGFHIAFAFGEQPTGLPLCSAPLQCFALSSGRRFDFP